MTIIDRYVFPHLGGVLRPVHVTLSEPHPSIRSLVQTLEDLYYNDKTLSQEKYHDIHSSKFDVRENNKAFFLKGEFPSIGNKEEILIQKLGPRTLFVKAKVVRFNLEDEQERGVGYTSSEVNNYTEERIEDSGKAKESDIYTTRLSERYVGHLQRSFTFPSAIDIGQAKPRLRHKLLVIRVPKIKNSRSKDINIICIKDQKLYQIC